MEPSGKYRMIDHPNISVTTAEPLSDDAVMCWMRCVIEAGPPGILSSEEIAPGRNLQFYRLTNHGNNTYVAALSRNLSTDEASNIAKNFDKHHASGDFTISWSQEPIGDPRIEAVRDDLLKVIALEASKANHNSWVQKQADIGWRYGPGYDSAAKTSPMCVNWDRLPDKYKRGELHRMMSLLSVLDRMNLRIVK